MIKLSDRSASLVHWVLWGGTVPGARIREGVGILMRILLDFDIYQDSRRGKHRYDSETYTYEVLMILRCWKDA